MNQPDSGNPSSESGFETDPIALLNGLYAHTARMQEQAAAFAEVQQRAVGTAENEFLRIEVHAGRITDLTFTDRAPTASPVRVREAIMDAYRDASARANNTSAQLLRTLGQTAMADGVSVSAPEEVQDRAAELARDEEAAPTPVDPDAVTPERAPWQSVEEMWADPALDDEDLDDFIGELAELGYDEVPHHDSTDWQGDLDRRMEALAKAAEGLPERLAQITASAECKALVVTVNGFGLLQQLTLRPGAADRSATELSTDFRTTYAAACAEASAQVTEAVPAQGTEAESFLADLTGAPGPTDAASDRKP